MTVVLLLLWFWMWWHLLDMYFPILEKLCLFMSIYSNIIFFYNIRLFLILNHLILHLFFLLWSYLFLAHLAALLECFACIFNDTSIEQGSIHLVFPNIQDLLLTLYQLFRHLLYDIWPILFLFCILLSWNHLCNYVCVHPEVGDSNVPCGKQLL